MDRNMANSNSEKNIESFVPIQLETNWPFSIDFTVDFFEWNKYGSYSSLKDFLISTWLDYKAYYLEDSREEDFDYDSDEILESQDIDSWPRLRYEGFFIENNRVFFKEVVKVVNQKTRDFTEEKRDFTEEKRQFKVYSLNDISYETLICKGIESYIDLFCKGRVMNFHIGPLFK